MNVIQQIFEKLNKGQKLPEHFNPVVVGHHTVQYAVDREKILKNILYNIINWQVKLTAWDNKGK